MQDQFLLFGWYPFFVLNLFFEYDYGFIWFKLYNDGLAGESPNEKLHVHVKIFISTFPGERQGAIENAVA